MRTRIIFIIVAVGAAAGAAALTGLAVVVAGLAARMQAADLIAVTAVTITATFAAVVALAAVAASLLFRPLTASPREAAEDAAAGAYPPTWLGAAVAAIQTETSRIALARDDIHPKMLVLPTVPSA